MFYYKKQEIILLAKENGFKSETLEKVLRLIDVLEFINNNKILSTMLILKGGTAINFTIFNLPRLSVDIDLDFSMSVNKEDMLIKRKEIMLLLRRYMEINGYNYHNDSKIHYALDSFVFSYVNILGNKDNLKIEINYMNRTHIYESITTEVSISFLQKFNIRTLNKYELFGSKIKALIERCTVRDIYDVYQMIKNKVFSNEECCIIRKCVIFYLLVGSTNNFKYNDIILQFYDKIKKFNIEKIPQYLSATLRNNEKINMKLMISIVMEYINNLMVLNDKEEKFITLFEKNIYDPSLLFNDEQILDRIKFHPMALLKVS